MVKILQQLKFDNKVTYDLGQLSLLTLDIVSLQLLREIKNTFRDHFEQLHQHPEF